eukprot:654068-Pleurochrysis_carterae.AAC.1
MRSLSSRGTAPSVCANASVDDSWAGTEAVASVFVGDGACLSPSSAHPPLRRTVGAALKL